MAKTQTISKKQIRKLFNLFIIFSVLRFLTHHVIDVFRYSFYTDWISYHISDIFVYLWICFGLLSVIYSFYPKTFSGLPMVIGLLILLCGIDVELSNTSRHVLVTDWADIVMYCIGAIIYYWILKRMRIWGF